jgi:2-keto-4-pentenoate hydratase/2-oxohepta-3-ene-1,7-dioic acid hydratase in catechol pathway
VKVVTFTVAAGQPRAGVLVEDGSTRVLDLTAASRVGGKPTDATALFTDTATLFAAGPKGLDVARSLLERAREDVHQGPLAPALFDIGDVRLLAPVPRPRRIRDFLTSEGHVRKVGIKLGPAFQQMPVSYKGNPDSVIGPEEEIPWPAYTDQLDYELEPAFVVGAGGRDIPASEAWRHIAGVTLFNDVSARDIQALPRARTSAMSSVPAWRLSMSSTSSTWSSRPA